MVADQAEPLLAAVAAFHDAAGLVGSCSTPSAQNSLQANRPPSTRHCRIRPSTTGNEFPHQAHFLNFERCDIAFLRRVGRTFRRTLCGAAWRRSAAPAVLAVTKPRIFEGRREPAGKAHSCDRQHIGPGALSLMSASPTGDHALATDD